MPACGGRIIPASLYFFVLAGANQLSSTPLQGKCAVHVGSGTGSMRRALQLTDLFVIGIDIEHTVETGTRAEHTSYVRIMIPLKAASGSWSKPPSIGSGSPAQM